MVTSAAVPGAAAPRSGGRAAPTRVLRRLTSEHGEAQEEVACPLCDAETSEKRLEAKDLLYGKPGTYSVVRCTACGLSYVTPRPTFESLGAHYPDDYFCYVPPEASPPLIRPIIVSMAKGSTMRRIGMMEKVIGKITPDMQLVDVGCGLNDLLFHIKGERGAVGIGVDMKDTMIARSRDVLQMPIVEGTLASAGFSDGQFDVATMIEYLEHELNPRAVLAEARRVLRTGGHLVIEIPEPTGWPARAFGARWANLDVPRHLVFFDKTTLGRALSELGFELVSYETFTLPFFVGTSVLFWLGRHNAMRNTFSTPFLAGLLGAPFLPALPWIPEFAFAVARAV